MEINWSDIIEGWTNHILPSDHLKEKIKEVSTERLSICSSCKWNSKNVKGNISPFDYCTDCGCPLIAKTKCLSCYCGLPSPKWKAVLTEDEEEILNKDESPG